MADNTAIEWADTTWNPVWGCTKVSAGCDHCYAERLVNGRLSHLHEGGFGTVRLRPEQLDKPLRWKRPRRIFVNSMSDLFHDAIPDEYIARVFAVMALARRHTFQVLTKRHGRMRSLLTSLAFESLVRSEINDILDNGAKYPPEWDPEAHDLEWPLPNVWLGVSVENQQWADIRIPALLGTPAAVRFLSCEPLLGPVNLDLYLSREVGVETRGITVDWVIVGGESGPGARPMHTDWARSLRDQCTEAEVAFHFKQWGEYRPTGGAAGTHRVTLAGDFYPNTGTCLMSNEELVDRVGKKAAGRALDGRTWDEFPEAVSA